MSHNSISTFFVVVALLYATSSTPFADATFIRSINVTGRLCCTANGNCLPTSTGVSGATVTLRCLVGFTVAATTTTDVAGNFVLTAAALPPFTLPFCFVTVQLPLTGAASGSCLLLGAAAPRTLTAIVQITSILNGGAATGTASAFI